MREKVMAVIDKIITDLLDKGYQVEDIKPLSIDDGEGSVVLRYVCNRPPGG